MAPEKKSVERKSSKRSVEKYASKLVGEIVDNLSAKMIKSIKANPKSTTKWLGKMKLSIQKKVSQSSLEIFVKKVGGRPSTSKDNNPEVLMAEIDKTKNAIAIKANRIKEEAIKVLKQSANNYKPSPPVIDGIQQQQGKRFESHLVSIGDKFKEIAQNVDSVSSDILGRIAALKTTMQTVQLDFAKIKASSVRPRVFASSHNSSGGGGAGGGGGGITPAAARVGRSLQ